jgi:hypothetical protein
MNTPSLDAIVELGIGADVGRINYGSNWKETAVGCAGRGEIATLKRL